MIISKVINKLFRTTLFMFLILCVFTITNYNNEKTLRTNVEIKNIEEIPETIIYLLSDDNYLVKTNIYLENNSIETKANKIIEFLKTNNNKLPSGLNGYLLNNISINKINLEDNNLKIDFSKEFLNIKNKELVITGLVYSLTNLSNVDTIEIFVPENNSDYIYTNPSKSIKSRSLYSYQGLTSKDPYTVFLSGNSAYSKLEMNNDSNRRLIVFKDSYANAFIPFLVPYYRTITIIDPRYYFEDISKCMKKLKQFHDMKLKVNHEFNIVKQIDFYESLWLEPKSVFDDYQQTKNNVLSLIPFINKNKTESVLTHIDAVPDNFLFSNKNGKESIQLIDWEYAGMQDPHVDIAMFCIYSLYDSKDEIDKVIDLYFENKCDSKTRIKIYCYVALCGFLWSNWCEYKRQLGVEFGEYSLKQYRYAKDFYKIASKEIEELNK